MVHLWGVISLMPRGCQAVPTLQIFIENNIRKVCYCIFKDIRDVCGLVIKSLF